MALETIPQKLWHWFIEPSSQISEPDERRQAATLSAILLSLIAAAVPIEIITILVIDMPSYTGYYETIASVLLLVICYGISRTHYIRLAAITSVAVLILSIFVSGWSQPYSVAGGLLDYLIFPLWLASLYLSLRTVVILFATEMIGLLITPLLIPAVQMNVILVGPFSFLVITTILLIALTRYRDQLERDRQAQLVQKELQSEKEAARSNTLLRVAQRLNAQHTPEDVLTTISDEVSRALNTPAAIIALFDPRKNVLRPAAGIGISPKIIQSMAPLPRSAIDLSRSPTVPFRKEFEQLHLHSLASAFMVHGEELIGSLNALSPDEKRTFSEDERLLLQGIADQAALAIVNTQLYRDARRRLENLQAMHAIELAIASNHSLSENLAVLLEKIVDCLNVDAAVILLLNERNLLLEFAASHGFVTPSLRYTRLRMGHGLAGRAAQQRKIIQIRDLQTDPQSLIASPAFSREGFASYFAAPLIARDQVKGVLEIYHRSPLDPDEEWLGLLNALAGQAAIAIENTNLFEDLQRTNEELLQSYDSTIEGWSRALDLRDRETEGHTLRVTELSVEMGRAFGLTDTEIRHIRWGALLHDIGKMGVPDRILLKDSTLTPEEWEIMRKHPSYAYDMLYPIRYLRPALDIPYCHHEKWNGQGYPRGLRGEAIPLAARIFAVVDVWDALTRDRPYRAAWPRDKALELIVREAGAHFDPLVVDVFLDLFQHKEVL